MRTTRRSRHWPCPVKLRFAKIVPFVCAAAALAMAVILASGCHKPQGSVLGKAPSGDLRTILAVKSGDTPSQVTLSGVMFEKCPVAGCWFRMRDGTDLIKVDTKTAGFVVVNVPLNKQVTVSGKVAMQGDELVIEASGLRY